MFYEVVPLKNYVRKLELWIWLVFYFFAKNVFLNAEIEGSSLIKGKKSLSGAFGAWISWYNKITTEYFTGFLYTKSTALIR